MKSLSFVECIRLQRLKIEKKFEKYKDDHHGAVSEGII